MIEDTFELVIVIIVFLFALLAIIGGSQAIILKVNTGYEKVYPSIYAEMLYNDVSAGHLPVMEHISCGYVGLPGMKQWGISSSGTITPSTSSEPGRAPADWKHVSSPVESFLLIHDTPSSWLLTIVKPSIYRSNGICNIYASWYGEEQKVTECRDKTCKIEVSESSSHYGKQICIYETNKQTMMTCIPEDFPVEEAVFPLSKHQLLYAYRDGDKIRFEVK